MLSHSRSLSPDAWPPTFRRPPPPPSTASRAARTARGTPAGKPSSARRAAPATRRDARRALLRRRTERLAARRDARALRGLRRADGLPGVPGRQLRGLRVAGAVPATRPVRRASVRHRAVRYRAEARERSPPGSRSSGRSGLGGASRWTRCARSTSGLDLQRPRARTVARRAAEDEPQGRNRAGAIDGVVEVRSTTRAGPVRAGDLRRPTRSTRPISRPMTRATWPATRSRSTR